MFAAWQLRRLAARAPLRDERAVVEVYGHALVGARWAARRCAAAGAYAGAGGGADGGGDG